MQREQGGREGGCAGEEEGRQGGAQQGRARPCRRPACACYPCYPRPPPPPPLACMILSPALMPLVLSMQARVYLQGG